MPSRLRLAWLNDKVTRFILIEKFPMILGIETSCDETGVALYDAEQGLVSHRVYSQIKLHAEYGGVVPELASRDHVRKILPLVQEVLDEAGIQKTDVTGVAYTSGPGLVGALMVGTAVGRSLAWAWKVPSIGVHHMEGHLLAPMLDDTDLDFPFVALLVSGGHSQLVSVKGIGEYELLGDTLDDAVGEAFDKTAKMMGLPYPGGPELAKLALQGNPDRFKFPRPMTDRPGLDFSFSGLKTFALNTLHDNLEEAKAQDSVEQLKADIAIAFEIAVVETMLIKCRRAVKQTGAKRLVLAGGVSANRRLRQHLNERLGKEGVKTYWPKSEFCTDNGAMIAFAGYQRLKAKHPDSLSFAARARWPLVELPAI